MSKKAFTMIVITLFILLTVTFGGVVLAEVADYWYYKTVELVIGNRSALVDGKIITMEKAPYIKEGRTMVPFRFLAESMGAEVSWNHGEQIAGFSLKERKVIVPIGLKTAMVNGVETTLDAPAEIVEGRTYVPLRFVSEALGAKVEYANNTVLVTMIDTTNWLRFSDPQFGVLICPPDWTVDLDTTALRMYSPTGSVLSLGIISGNLWEVSSAKLESYIMDGYEMADETVHDAEDPPRGITYALVKADTTNFDQSSVITLVAIQDGDNTLLIEILARLRDMHRNASIVEEILSGGA